MKVLCIFKHRPEKVKALLPYADVEYKFIVPKGYIPLIPVPNIHLPGAIKYSIRLMIQAIRYHPDVVISHGSNYGCYSWLIAKLTGAKLITRLGGDAWAESKTQPSIMLETYGRRRWFQSKVHFKLLLWQLQHADKVIIVSPLLNLNGIRDKSYVISTTCNIAKFATAKIKKQFKQITVITNANYRCKMQSIYGAVEAIYPHIVNDRSNRLVIVAPGELHDEFKRNIPEHEQITVKSWEDNMPGLYQQSDLVVYWSEFDICPNVVLEAWASKTPLIANKHEWSEQMIPPDTAILSDLDCLLRDIGKCLNSDTKAMVNKGYQYVNQHHSEYVAGNKLKTLLEEVVR